MAKNIITQTKMPLNTANRNGYEAAATATGNTIEIGTKPQEMILNYYNSVKKQTKQSFNCAISAAIISIAFFVYAIQKDESTILPVIMGALIMVISVIHFYLYDKATKQFSIFHICLETSINLQDGASKK